MSSKTDAIVKLAIVFFISLLSFSIGTFVGKKYSDNQHEISSLEPQKKSEHSERAVASEATHEGEKAGAMTDDDIAKLAEEFVADDTKTPEANAHNSEVANHSTEHQTEHAVKNEEPTQHVSASNSHESKNADATTHDEPSFAAKSVVAGKTPVPAETHEKHIVKEDRVPSSLPKNVAQYTAGKFTIQVAAYADEGEAQKMASDLKNKGYSAFYFPAEIRGRTWYRVSVGQFATQKEAQSYKSEFLNKSKVETAIIQKITE